jgi:predicted ATPase
VSGTAGTGKTTLAVQAAHLLGAAFTGGSFFVDLRAAAAHHRRPGTRRDR